MFSKPIQDLFLACGHSLREIIIERVDISHLDYKIRYIRLGAVIGSFDSATGCLAIWKTHGGVNHYRLVPIEMKVAPLVTFWCKTCRLHEGVCRCNP